MSMGISPYHNKMLISNKNYDLINLLKTDLYEGLMEIKNIKKCIYEGFRYNICMYNDEKSTYINQSTKSEIQINSKLTHPLIKEKKNCDDIQQLRPKYIIVPNITLLPSFVKKNMYEFTGGDISVMDGFVNVDNGFLN